MIPPMSAANKNVARRVVEEMLNGNPDLADELFASTLAGKQGGLAKKLRAAFPDLTLTVEELIAEGDMVACHWSAKGTQRGPMLGIPPTNAEASWTGTSIYRIQNEKITKAKTNWDSLELIQQLHDAAKRGSSS